jgi:hypothetical protein
MQCQTSSQVPFCAKPSQATFLAQVGDNLFTLPASLGLKTDAVWKHVTGYDTDAAEPFHVFHMDQMRDDAAVSNQFPRALLCQAKPCHFFGLGWQQFVHFTS